MSLVALDPTLQMIVSPSGLDAVLVLIPVRNEAETIGDVLKVLQTQGLKRIRVVDNGSTDASAAIAQSHGAEVIREPRPGYGQACWSGLQNLPNGVHWILFCDGDGSDDLSELPKFWQYREQADLILGDRRATATGRKTLSPVQNFGNALATTLIRWGWGHRYHDLGPLRLIRRDALDAMQMGDRGFGWTVEMQVRAVEQGLRIQEFPVQYRPRQGGHSKISGTISGCFQAGVIILSTLAYLYFQRSNPSQKPTSDTLKIPRETSLSLASSASIRVHLRSGFLHPHPILPSTLLILGTTAMAQFGHSDQVPQLWWSVAVMGAGFVWSWRWQSLSPLWFWGVAIATRLLLLPMEPNSDIFRYMWEGLIQNAGFSPYHLPPSAEILEPLRPGWWFRINHADVSAIYPPITQLGFRLLAWLSPSVLLFKLSFVAADLAVCKLLCDRFQPHRALLYAWNPLILYSFAGTGHYDSWFLLPLVLAWFAAESLSPTAQAFSRSALGIGISAGLKWISLPLLGFLAVFPLRKGKWKLALGIPFVGILPFVLSALPYCDSAACPLVPVSSGFVSSDRSAEWVPYLLAQVAPQLATHNILYGLLLGIVLLGLMARSNTFLGYAESYFFALLVLSPIIHIWYFTWLVPFAVATQNLGTRLVSFSAFVYLVLFYRQSLGDFSWALTPAERTLLWLPFLLGWMWTRLHQPSTPHPSTSR